LKVKARYREVTENYRPLIGIPAASKRDPEYVATPTYRFNGLYPAALVASGADPIVIPLDLPEESLRSIYARLDGLCLAGGVDVDPGHYGEPPHPDLGEVDQARDDVELALTRWALHDNLPILAICRGIQLLNVAAGGSLYQDIPAQVDGALRHSYKLAESPWERSTHAVQLQADSRVQKIFGITLICTNSFHHQAVKEPGAGLIVTGRTEDGIVEALESPTHRFVVGVQWHPEGMFSSDPVERKLFAAFVASASRVAPMRHDAPDAAFFQIGGEQIESR
jgi:putative glutamine amidotransferase